MKYFTQRQAEALVGKHVTIVRVVKIRNAYERNDDSGEWLLTAGASQFHGGMMTVHPEDIQALTIRQLEIDYPDEDDPPVEVPVIKATAITVSDGEYGG